MKHLKKIFWGIGLYCLICSCQKKIDNTIPQDTATVDDFIESVKTKLTSLPADSMWTMGIQSYDTIGGKAYNTLGITFNTNGTYKFRFTQATPLRMTDQISMYTGNTTFASYKTAVDSSYIFATTKFLGILTINVYTDLDGSNLITLSINTLFNGYYTNYFKSAFQSDEAMFRKAILISGALSYPYTVSGTTTIYAGSSARMYPFLYRFFGNTTVAAPGTIPADSVETGAYKITGDVLPLLSFPNSKILTQLKDQLKSDFDFYIDPTLYSDSIVLKGVNSKNQNRYIGLYKTDTASLSNFNKTYANIYSWYGMVNYVLPKSRVYRLKVLVAGTENTKLHADSLVSWYKPDFDKRINKYVFTLKPNVDMSMAPELKDITTLMPQAVAYTLPSTNTVNAYTAATNNTILANFVGYTKNQTLSDKGIPITVQVKK